MHWCNWYFHDIEKNYDSIRWTVPKAQWKERNHDLCYKCTFMDHRKFACFKCRRVVACKERITCLKAQSKIDQVWHEYYTIAEGYNEPGESRIVNMLEKYSRLCAKDLSFVEKYLANDPTCPSCSKKCVFVGTKFEAPKYKDIKGWVEQEKFWLRSKRSLIK